MYTSSFSNELNKGKNKNVLYPYVIYIACYTYKTIVSKKELLTATV